jgi:hypothetical protein
MVMEVAEKLSESMSLFTGNSSRKNKLVKLVLDDPHMIYTKTGHLIVRHQTQAPQRRWQVDEISLEQKQRYKWEESTQRSKHLSGCLRKAPHYIIGNRQLSSVNPLVWILRLRRRIT